MSDIGNQISEKQKGKLHIVGIGPGDLSHLTEEAKRALTASDCIVGYKPYLLTIKSLVQGKELFSFSMKQEKDRAHKAIQLARDGRIVSLVSSGDPGIYAMAGLALQILAEGDTKIEISIVPGISALNMSAALLGAPLMHDFAVISLSDLLTPLDLIEKRIEAAAQSDYVIVMYNPKSKGRPDLINKAQNIMLKSKGPQTPVGIVKKDDGEQKVTISTLKDFTKLPIDMLSTVIVGNSQTFVSNERMITPRGYDV